MAQQLRVLTVLPEGTGSIPGNNTVTHDCLELQHLCVECSLLASADTAAQTCKLTKKAIHEIKIKVTKFLI